MINHYCKYLLKRNKIIICNEFADFLLKNNEVKYIPTKKKILFNTIHKYFIFFRIDLLIGIITILLSNSLLYTSIILVIVFFIDILNSKKVIFKKGESYLYERKKYND